MAPNGAIFFVSHATSKTSSSLAPRGAFELSGARISSNCLHVTKIDYAVLEFCEQQAEDLLSPHIDLIFAFVAILGARRAMSGDEVDEAIASILARFDLAAEEKRRRQRQQRIANARNSPGG
jgi:hypothetical protein